MEKEKRLLVQCWCKAHYVLVRSEDVKRGKTLSCRYFECFDPEEKKKAPVTGLSF